MKKLSEIENLLQFDKFNKLYEEYLFKYKNDYHYRNFKKYFKVINNNFRIIAVSPKRKMIAYNKNQESSVQIGNIKYLEKQHNIKICL